jgi:hypothetical protein
MRSEPPASKRADFTSPRKKVGKGALATPARSARKEELEGQDPRHDQGQHDVAHNLWMKLYDLQALCKRDGTVPALEITDRDGVATFWAGF